MINKEKKIVFYNKVILDILHCSKDELLNILYKKNNINATQYEK